MLQKYADVCYSLTQILMGCIGFSVGKNKLDDTKQSKTSRTHVLATTSVMEVKRDAHAESDALWPWSDRHRVGQNWRDAKIG
jgi:hypothetical protein